MSTTTTNSSSNLPRRLLTWQVIKSKSTNGAKIGEFVPFKVFLGEWEKAATHNKNMKNMKLSELTSDCRSHLAVLMNDGYLTLSSSGEEYAITAQGIRQMHLDFDEATRRAQTDPTLTMSAEEKLNYLRQKEKEGLLEKELLKTVENEKEMQNRLVDEGKAVKFAGVFLPKFENVPEEACLPNPDHYKVPSIGKAAQVVKNITIALKNRRSTFVWGLPGIGKDACIHAYAAARRQPSMIFTVNPNEDIQSWFFIRAFSDKGTVWEEGNFLKAVRDGYKTSTGEVIPYMILVSDFDRATRNQVETLRLIMDSIKGRIMGPNGQHYSVLPGTQIVATANTSGSGDERGRCISANAMDASILERFERKFKLESIDWSEEAEVLKQKFPIFTAKMPQEIWANLGNAVNALRTQSDQEKILAEFGHRVVCSWVGCTQDILEEDHRTDLKIKTLDQASRILKEGLSTILDSMPSSDVRTAVENTIDPHLQGGSLNV